MLLEHYTLWELARKNICFRAFITYFTFIYSPKHLRMESLQVPSLTGVGSLTKWRYRSVASTQSVQGEPQPRCSISINMLLNLDLRMELKGASVNSFKWTPWDRWGHQCIEFHSGNRCARAGERKHLCKHGTIGSSHLHTLPQTKPFWTSLSLCNSAWWWLYFV